MKGEPIFGPIFGLRCAVVHRTLGRMTWTASSSKFNNLPLKTVLYQNYLKRLVVKLNQNNPKCNESSICWGCQNRVMVGKAGKDAAVPSSYGHPYLGLYLCKFLFSLYTINKLYFLQFRRGFRVIPILFMDIPTSVL